MCINVNEQFILSVHFVIKAVGTKPIRSILLHPFFVVIHISFSVIAASANIRQRLRKTRYSLLNVTSMRADGLLP